MQKLDYVFVSPLIIVQGYIYNYNFQGYILVYWVHFILTPLLFLIITGNYTSYYFDDFFVCPWKL